MLDAVFAARERSLETEEIDDLRERERHHRELQALQTDREIADHHAKHGARQPTEQDRDLSRHAPVFRGPGRDVASHAEEGSVAEG